MDHLGKVQGHVICTACPSYDPHGEARKGSAAAVKASEESLLFLLKHGKASHQLAAVFHPCTCLLKQLVSTASSG